jgi:hypothetical protein
VECRVLAALAAEDEQVAAEWINANDLLGFGRKAVEPVA